MPGPSASYKPNRQAFRDMAVGPEVATIVLAVAEKAKPIAEGLSEEFRETGEYAGSFNVRAAQTVLTTSFGSHPVAAGILENLAPYAAAVEWGNPDDRRPHRVLGRTLDALDHG